MKDIILLRTVALMIVLGTSISAQRERSLTLTSSVQFDAALPPPILCPGVNVQFNCIAIDFPLGLDWVVNGSIAEQFTATSPVNRTTNPKPGLTAILNSVNVISVASSPTSVDFDTTLTAILNKSVFSGGVISCGSSIVETTNLTVKYTNKPPPPAPEINADNLQIESSGIINAIRLTVNFNSSFTNDHEVEEYRVRSQSPTCSPQNGTRIPAGGTYTCDGLETGREFNFTFTAVNCGNQESEESVTVTLTPQRSPRPSFCRASAIYNQTTETLSGIVTIWNRVKDPPNIVSSISQNVSFYNISYISSRTIDTVNVPLSSQLCDTDGNCRYVYSVSSDSFIDPRFSYVARVEAGNIVGTGDPLICQGQINSQNSIFSVSTSAPTFMDDSTTIQCRFSDPPSSQNVTRECQLCYSTLANSQTLSRCLTESTTDESGKIVTFRIRLPSFTEESYGPFFYQLTAIDDNVTLATIQGQQYTGCRPLLLGNISTPEINSRCLALSDQTQQVAGIKGDNNTIFCYNSGGTLLGTVAMVYCDDGYMMVGPERVTCGSDGSWGELPRCVKPQEPTSTDIASLLGWQIALTVLGVLLWFLAAALVVAGLVVLIRLAKEKFNASFRFWHSLYIFLLVLTVLLLVISAALWIALGAVANDSSTGANVCIAAFVLSLLAAVSVTVALSLIKLMPIVLSSQESIDLPHSGNGIEVKELPKNGGSGGAPPPQDDDVMLDDEKKEDLVVSNQVVKNGEPTPELSTILQEELPTREQDREEHNMNDSTLALLSEAEKQKPIDDEAIRNLLHELQIEPYTVDTAVPVDQEENGKEKTGDEVTEANQSEDDSTKL